MKRTTLVLFGMVCGVLFLTCWPKSDAKRLPTAHSPPRVRLASSLTVLKGDQAYELPHRAGMRLAHAVTKTGGLPGFGRQQVKILRGGQTMGPYDMSRIDAGNANNPLLEPDDQIIVPQD